MVGQHIKRNIWLCGISIPSLVAIASVCATEVGATPITHLLIPPQAADLVQLPSDRPPAATNLAPGEKVTEQLQNLTPTRFDVQTFDLDPSNGVLEGKISVAEVQGRIGSGESCVQEQDPDRIAAQESCLQEPQTIETAVPDDREKLFFPTTEKAGDRIDPDIKAGDRIDPDIEETFSLFLDESLTEMLIVQNAPPPAPPTEDPDRNPFLQPTPEVEPTPPEDEKPTLTPPTEETAPETTSPPIPIREVNVIGSTVFSEETINEITAKVEGQSVTIEELRAVADRITQLYLDRGYITSRAILIDQEIKDGVVVIRVIEGTLETIEVEGNRRVRASYIRSRIELGAVAPLNTAKLEDQLRLLRLDPLFENIEASLRAGNEIGQSILTVRVQEASPFGMSLGVDNLSPPSVGSERLGGNLRYRNITGFGDEISVAYYWGTGDSQVYDFSYRIPINAMNGTIGLRVAPNENGIVQAPFDELNIEGQSELYELSFRQPLVRSPREEFALSLGFTYQESQTFLDGEPFPFGEGPDEDGISRTSTIKLGADYLRRDVQGAWSLRSLVNIGTGLFDATSNDDPVPDASFVSWIGQVQRVQRLGASQLLILQADIQLSPNSLLSSQQFVIGGGQSLRGYRQNVRSGDNGFRFSIEDRIILQRDASGSPIFQLAPFIDIGTVWNHVDNPNKLPRQTFLAGIGAGLIWQLFPGFNIRIDYGQPIFKIDDKGTNAQDEGFYFTVNYQL